MVEGGIIDILSPRQSGDIDELLNELNSLPGVQAQSLDSPEGEFEVLVEADQPQETDALVLGVVLIR